MVSQRIYIFITFPGDYNVQSKVKHLSYISLDIQNPILYTVICIYKVIFKNATRGGERGSRGKRKWQQQQEKKGGGHIEFLSFSHPGPYSNLGCAGLFYKAVGSNSPLSLLFHLHFPNIQALGGGGQ